MIVTGWDIGGVHTKMALVRDGRLTVARSRAFELQRAPTGLPRLLRDLSEAEHDAPSAAHAVTMTAELSQMFLTKREGVAHVVDAVSAAFPGAAILVYGTDGQFHGPAEAKRRPLVVAAANWAATAAVVGRHVPDAILLDTGTTTTDIIPIVSGQPAATGRTDPERLASGELVYTGAVRTPVEAVVSHVPFRGVLAGVSAEAFALSGDVHLWRGRISADDYTTPTPDGRPATRHDAATRLARVVCADREMLDDDALDAMAGWIADAQVARIAAALRIVRARHPAIAVAFVTGVGAFLARAAAESAGLAVSPLPAALGPDAPQCSPAAAVALLLSARLDHGFVAGG